ncbi:MAG: hypothetical protein E6833_35095, partial [Bradyrhizobium sp.]|nr:hypothetical protein [Bradyrhizobium sp.]
MVAVLGGGLECFKKATRQAWPGALSGMSWQAVVRDDHDAFQQNRILILSLCLSMIFSENRFPLFRIMLPFTSPAGSRLCR